MVVFYGVMNMAYDLIAALLATVVTALMSALSLLFKQKTDHKVSQADMEEAKNAADISRMKLQDGNKDVISLMINNVSELREYYVISKRQANRVFSSTLLVCILGFVVFIAGIIASAISGQDLAIYTTISGCIIEVIAGLFFWLYKSTAAQLNLYHERLGRTEKYLTAMQLAEKISTEKQDETYSYIIEAILRDSSNNTKHNDKPTE